MYQVPALKEYFINYMNENSFDKSPKGLFKPVDYILRLGGKRLRPILVLMSYNLFHNSISAALPIAYAIEIFHNFSLVHDDIMDEAPIRRGKPTIHHKYGLNTGILSGDVMLIYAYQYLLKIKQKELIPEIVTIFTEVAEKVCIGQQYDVDFETSNKVSISDYLKMIEYKTAVLLVGALKMGATLAKASSIDIHHLGEFGKNIGLAFQMQDDLLDTFGEADKFGKMVGGDIVQNKKTYLVLKTLELADSKDKTQLIRLMNNEVIAPTEKVELVKSIFIKYDIQQLTYSKQQEYQSQAMQHLAKVSVTQERKVALTKLANDLLLRKI